MEKINAKPISNVNPSSGSSDIYIDILNGVSVNLINFPYLFAITDEHSLYASVYTMVIFDIHSLYFQDLTLTFSPLYKYLINFLTNSFLFPQDEWVISRVFKKPGLANTGGSAEASISVSNGTGTSKKTKIPSNISTNYREQPSSPSSVSLPPLLDPTTTLGYTDSSWSYDSRSTNTPVITTAITEHVSCFSTATTTTALGLDVDVDSFNHLLPPVPPGFDPFPRFVSRNVSSLSNFRSFQENFNHFPYYGSSSASTMTTPVNLPSSHGGTGMNYWLQTTAEENETKAGLLNGGLDCVWNY